MTTDSAGDLVRSLVDLTEVVQSLNMSIRTEVERRAGESLLSNEAVDLLSYVLGNPDATLDGIADATGYRAATLVQSGRALERRGLVTKVPGDGGPGTGRFRATAAGVQLRNAARDIGSQHLRYAIAGISAQDRAHLERAASALSALSSALGYQGLHPSYR